MQMIGYCMLLPLGHVKDGHKDQGEEDDDCISSVLSSNPERTALSFPSLRTLDSSL